MKKTPKELLDHLESLTMTAETDPAGFQKITWSDGSTFIFANRLPQGFNYGICDASNEYMMAADKSRLESGCFKQQTGAVIVLRGEIISNGANIGELKTWCEREKLGCKTGEGYEHCKNICKQFHHAERTAIHRALSQGLDLTGAKLYLSGHWWACAPCWKWCIDAGITEIILDKDASEKFTKPKSLFEK